MSDVTLGQQYQDMHEQGHFQGFSALEHGHHIDLLVKEHNAQSLLDYGCGKGFQYTVRGLHNEWGGLMPTLFDPYCAEHSRRPEGTFDGVICTDVMEHVPEEDVFGVLRDIFTYADKFVYVVICTRPAKKCLPDGRNCHLTVQEPEWWSDKINEALDSVGKKLAIKVVYQND